jgi:hypothetical protein
MAKRKKGKRQTTIYKILQSKIKMDQQKIPKTEGEHVCSGRASISCSNSGDHRVTIVKHPVIIHERGKGREL